MLMSDYDTNLVSFLFWIFMWKFVLSIKFCLTRSMFANSINISFVIYGFRFLFLRCSVDIAIIKLAIGHKYNITFGRMHLFISCVKIFDSVVWLRIYKTHKKSLIFFLYIIGTAIPIPHINQWYGKFNKLTSDRLNRNKKSLRQRYTTTGWC